MRKSVSLIPETHQSASSVTPQHLAESQTKIEQLKANGSSLEEIKAAEEEHQRLCNEQAEQLRQIYFKRHRL